MDSAQGIVLAAVLTLLVGLVLGYILGRGRELARQNEQRAAARDEASQILARARARRGDDPEGRRASRARRGLSTSGGVGAGGGAPKGGARAH